MYDWLDNCSHLQIQFASSVTKRFPYLRTNKKSTLTLVKGAPEVLLPSCSTYYSQDGSIQNLTSLPELEREVRDRYLKFEN